MPGGGDTVGGGVWETDDRIGTFVPGEAEGAGTLQGVRGGDVTSVDGRAHADSEREGSGGGTELGCHGPCRGTMDVPDGIPDRGVTMELPGSGMSRTCGDEDGNVGTLLPPAYPG